jgi:large subunit ribosomal protein L16
MAMMPKRVKWRKWHRGRVRGIATRGNRVVLGDYGLMSLEPGRVTAQQIEAGRITAARFLGNLGRLFIRIFPHRPVTKKPQETHMGGGKGDPAFYVAAVKPGTVIYELGGVTEELAKECFALIAHKMCVKTKFVVREGLAKE